MNSRAAIEPDHNAPFYSQERLAYFDQMMDRFSRLGARYLVFTPPFTRGSLLTRAEAWIINTQRGYVPTLVHAQKWPVLTWGDHPDAMTRDQSEWLKRNWGEGASLWGAEQSRRHGNFVTDQLSRHFRPSRRRAPQGGVDRGAIALWVIDCGPLDEERRPVPWAGTPFFTPVPFWDDLPDHTQASYRRRAASVLRAAYDFRRETDSHGR